MAKNLTITDLAGTNLDGWQVRKMTEAFHVDDDGQKTQSIGYFNDPEMAKAFIGPRSTNSHKRVREVFVLTNGTNGFVINDHEPVELVADETALLEIKERAVAKLSPEECKVLGLE